MVISTNIEIFIIRPCKQQQSDLPYFFCRVCFVLAVCRTVAGATESSDTINVASNAVLCNDWSMLHDESFNCEKKILLYITLPDTTQVAVTIIHCKTV